MPWYTAVSMAGVMGRSASVEPMVVHSDSSCARAPMFSTPHTSCAVNPYSRLALTPRGAAAKPALTRRQNTNSASMRVASPWLASMAWRNTLGSTPPDTVMAVAS